MNLSKLFEMQHELDQHIYEEHQVEAKDLLHDKVAALQVEISECANETRCFKYWSNKPASPKEVILEEYSDGLHLILSIGNDLDYTDFEYEPTQLTTTLTNMFIGLQSITSLLLTKNKTIYVLAFTQFIDLSFALGFKWDEVEQAYMDKNKINHQRQEEGY